MTIYEIKRRTSKTSYFFCRKTMKFFGQRLRDFRVRKQADKYLIYTVEKKTKALFDPKDNSLKVII